MMFVFKIQLISIAQKSISATYHSNDAFEPNSRKFDYVKSKSNVKYRSTRKSQKSIQNDRIIFTQNAKRQKSYVKNFQLEYQKFYDDYNHSSATYEMQNATYEMQNQSENNDYRQQSMQFRLSPRSKKKNVLYSFKKKSTFIIFRKKIVA